MEYLFVKFIHILSAAVLFGTGMGIAFYMFMANRRKDIAGIYFAARHVVIADWLFTTPAVVLQLATGLWLTQEAGYEYMDYWIFWGLILYFFIGLCWLPVVWMQIKMRDQAKIALETGTELPPSYWRMDRWWIRLGALAFPSILIIFYLMVFKPV
jgi:uncharacterized membrane protein